jgi:hypothetical protein
MYSTIVTGAFALPRMLPFCGIPWNEAAIVAESGRVDPCAAELPELPPVKTIARITASATATISASAIPSTFGDARRPPVLRTGGRATAACRCFRACFPLVMSSEP